MKKAMGICAGCERPEWYGSPETASEESLCICEHKRVKCDCCEHLFLKKDMSLMTMYLDLCKCCHEPVPHLMDNMAVGYFDRTTERAHTAMCVETFGDKLQIAIRSYHLGISVLFPAMTKKELVDHWLNEAPAWMQADIRLLFDSAILRLIPDHLSRGEMASLRSLWIQGRREAFAIVSL